MNTLHAVWHFHFILKHIADLQLCANLESGFILFNIKDLHAFPSCVCFLSYVMTLKQQDLLHMGMKFFGILIHVDTHVDMCCFHVVIYILLLT